MLCLTKADVKLALGKSSPNTIHRKIRYIGNQPGFEEVGKAAVLKRGPRHLEIGKRQPEQFGDDGFCHVATERYVARAAHSLAFA